MRSKFENCERSERYLTIERYNLQKGKEIPNRLRASSNVVDNYIQSRRNIRNQLKEGQEQNEQVKLNKQVEAEVIEEVKKQITKEFEKAFN